MLKHIANRLLVAVPVLILVSIIAFLLVQLVPGDPAVTLAGDNPAPGQIERLRELLGTDRPWYIQYVDWFGSALTGDLGRSLYTTQLVTDAIMIRLPVTLSLSFGALILAVIIGVPAGVLSSLRRNELPDRLIGLGASTSLALPNYFVGMLLILFVSLKLGWLPSSGYTPMSESFTGWLRSMILPSIALGLVPAAVVARQVRSSMIDIMNREYVQTAEAKGLGRFSVVVKHALRNAMIPAITALSTQFAVIVGGTVVIEQIFAIPGMGNLAYLAVVQRDIPMIQGVVLVTALVVQATNITVDLLYGWLNPRVRVG